MTLMIYGYVTKGMVVHYLQLLVILFFYLFVYSRHEVHSMNTHTLQNAG